MLQASLLNPPPAHPSALRSARSRCLRGLRCLSSHLSHRWQCLTWLNQGLKVEMSDPVLARKVSGIWKETFVSAVRSRAESFEVLSGHSEMKCATLCTLNPYLCYR